MNFYKYIFIAFALFSIHLSVIAQSSLIIAEDFSAKDTEGIPHILYPILDDGKIVVLKFFTTT